jgi:hypothetical protein
VTDTPASTRKLRWRFRVGDGDLDVIEIETEPTSGMVLSGERAGHLWHGTHVKARLALSRDKRWKRANLIGGGGEMWEAEAVARRLLGRLPRD